MSAFLVPLGFFGAALAVLCAVVAGIAVARGAGGLAGGAVGLWIPAAVLSLAASFAQQWAPLIVAGAALVGMLVIGGVLRAIIGSAESRASALPAPAETQAVAAPSSAPVATVTPRAVTSTSTGSLPALAS
ncbi:hypothetical protein [uncultured Microbacterium sp.]|uniref:hypothetical protein n=1 Tax=uncultured Microbacterium sp. TaxID=191216 RepID=UPI0028D8289B|nr:hypothetical protein [uncultured Microbacterium sp.]